MRTTLAAVLLLATAGALGGCGFVSAGGKAPVKPSTFVITGSAEIPLAASGGLAPGAPCTGPAGASDVVTGARIVVTGPDGEAIASSTLGPGIVSGPVAAPECSFPFQVWNVPGGDATYGIAVGGHAPQTFDGAALRESTPAVVAITPAA